MRDEQLNLGNEFQSDKNLKFAIDILYYYAKKIEKGLSAKEEIKNLDIKENEYIIKISDSMALSFNKKDSNKSFDSIKNTALKSIFNTLNENKQNFKYTPKTLEANEGINFPKEEIKFDEKFYIDIKNELVNKLNKLEYTWEYLSSLLDLLEQKFSYIPISSDSDISVYDHIKLSVAIGSCIFQYLSENNRLDTQQETFEKYKDFCNEKAFCLYSVDFSGIQDFIYGQYGKEDVLKNLRSRSFYLEILLENIIDELLEKLLLSRANLLYAGGGHAYFIFANTQNTEDKLKEFNLNIGNWLRKIFGIELFLASGYTSCSANEFKNEPSGAYSECFKRVSTEISKNKLQRYSGKQISELNNAEILENERECKVCHRSDKLNSEGECSLCAGFAKLSRKILENNIFKIVKDNKDSNLPIYSKGFLSTDTSNKNDDCIRIYAKNHLNNKNLSVKNIYVGDYYRGNTLEELVKDSVGIKRLGVFRADIDNLGKAFVSGFSKEQQTLSRSAVFSRRLTQFFKFYINYILKNGKFEIISSDNKKIERKAAIIYSGGDDVFIVGAWKDVLEFSVDLYNNLNEFTQGTLSISGGFGIYNPKYPISYIAAQTGELEENSKQLEGKNAITLFDEDNTYHWEEFIEEVIGEKFKVINRFFSSSQDKGKNFLYNLLELFRKRKDKINLARLAYTLARLENEKNRDDEEGYQELKEKVYEWMKTEKDARQVITAIYIYSYLIRKEEGENV